MVIPFSYDSSILQISLWKLCGLMVAFEKKRVLTQDFYGGWQEAVWIRSEFTPSKTASV